MDAFINRLTPEYLLLLAVVALVSIVLVVLIVSLVHYQLKALADDTALRREKQQAELDLRRKALEYRAAAGAPVEELLAAVPGAGDSDGLDAELAQRFGQLECKPEEIEELLTRALAAETDRKRAIMQVINRLVLTSDHDSIVAAVRPLCAPVVKTPASPHTTAAT